MVCWPRRVPTTPSKPVQCAKCPLVLTMLIATSCRLVVVGQAGESSDNGSDDCWCARLRFVAFACVLRASSQEPMEHGNLVQWSQHKWEEYGEHTLYCQFCWMKAIDDDSDDCWCARLRLVALASCVTPELTTKTMMVLDKLPRQSLHVHSSIVTRLASAIQPPRSPEIGDNLKEVDPSVFSMLPMVFTTDVVQGRWDRPVNPGKRVYVI